MILGYLGPGCFSQGKHQCFPRSAGRTAVLKAGRLAGLSGKTPRKGRGWSLRIFAIQASPFPAVPCSVRATSRKRPSPTLSTWRGGVITFLLVAFHFDLRSGCGQARSPRNHSIAFGSCFSRGEFGDRPGRPAGLKAGHAGPADRRIHWLKGRPSKRIGGPPASLLGGRLVSCLPAMLVEIKLTNP
jgi:hypothetical protein